MRRLFAAVSVAAALALAPALYSNEAPPEPTKVKGQKSRGSGKDENIKEKSDTNDAAKPPAAPPNKGGEKSRGGCMVHYNNTTAWKIQIYADGTYQGLLAPYGDAAAFYSGSSGTLYGKADFTDGSSLSWGPSYVVCRGGQFQWQLQ